MYHVFFYLSAADGRLGCFRVLAIVNNAAMNMGVHVSFGTNIVVFSVYIHRNGISRSDGSSLFIF